MHACVCARACADVHPYACMCVRQNKSSLHHLSSSVKAKLLLKRYILSQDTVSSTIYLSIICLLSISLPTYHHLSIIIVTLS